MFSYLLKCNKFFDENILHIKEVTTDNEFNQQKSINAITKFVDELNHGKNIREIISDTAPEEIQNLQCIESQMAMISIITKLGYQNISEEMIFEQLKYERIGFLNTIGSKAMVKFLAHTSLKTEQVLSCLVEQDFQAETVQKQVADILDIAMQVNMAQVHNET